MALQQRDASSLRPKCGCMSRAYASQEAAERALARIKDRRLRSVMPKGVVECWQGQWHLDEGQKVDTGPDRNTRALIAERDVWACAACGRPMDMGPYSIQHRDARGMGGTPDPAANSPANLILLCGSATSLGCHLQAEQRDALMNLRGFWLKPGQKPEDTPVDHFAYGWVFLEVDGSVTQVPGGAA